MNVEEETKGCDPPSPSTGDLELDEMLEDDEGTVICYICGEKPCDWIQYGEELIERGSETFSGETVSNNGIRKTVYRMYVYGKYGHLGKGKRVRIPLCVRDRIRERWPEANPEDYVGHKDEANPEDDMGHEDEANLEDDMGHKDEANSGDDMGHKVRKRKKGPYSPMFTRSDMRWCTRSNTRMCTRSNTRKDE